MIFVFCLDCFEVDFRLTRPTYIHLVIGDWIEALRVPLDPLGRHML